MLKAGADTLAVLTTAGVAEKLATAGEAWKEETAGPTE